MTDFRDQLIQLAHELEEQRESAHELWTWLPSYASTKIAHGHLEAVDMASEEAVMAEASTFLSFIASKDRTRWWSTHKEDALELFRCPCGDCEDEESSSHVTLEWLEALSSKREL
jgi:hypothetical protein